MGYVLRRLLALPLVLLLVTFLTFLLTSLVPGDVVEGLILRGGGHPTPEAVAALRAEMGLDAPLLVRYGHWLGRAATLDLGTSWLTHAPVADELAARLPATLWLAGAALGISTAAALAVGALTALRRDTWADRGALAATLLLRTTPDFVLAFGLMYVLAVRWPVLPIAGSGTWRHLVLPAAVLAAGIIPAKARLLRASLLEVLAEPYILSARARGLTSRTVLWRHAVPNALLPLVTSFGNSLGFLLGGAMVIENLFAWPGLGQLALKAVAVRDLPLLQGYVLLLALLVVLLNLLVDLAYGWLDPRIALEGEGSHVRA